MEKLKNYFNQHKAQLQVVLFMLFSVLAFVAQLLSRIICDVALKGMTGEISIWPFPKQAVGSFIAFLVSNIIAKAISYILNRKKTFNANNNAVFGVVVYTIMVVALIVIETIVGTPLQNWLYTIFGGAHTGTALVTATATNGSLYQLCGTISQMLYSAGDFVIVFLMDKYVIMKHK